MNNLTLDANQARSLRTQGWVKLENAVPQSMLAAALRKINSSLGRREGLDERMLGAFKAVSFCPDLRRDPALTGLVSDTPLASALGGIFGADELYPTDLCSIRLRFPEERAAGRPVLDRHSGPSDSHPDGLVDNYTALLAVQLNDLDEDASGYAVWSGSHLRFADYFKRAGAMAALKGLPDIELPEPEHVALKPGDAILFHYLTGRSRASNDSPDISYVAEFQVDTYKHDTVWWKDGYHWQDFVDIWYDWQGLAS